MSATTHDRLDGRCCSYATTTPRGDREMFKIATNEGSFELRLKYKEVLMYPVRRTKIC